MLALPALGSAQSPDAKAAAPPASTAPVPSAAPAEAPGDLVRAGEELVRRLASQPLPSGPGVLVCEPVPATPALAAFGAGLGRWLHLVVGGQGEFGKTPHWRGVGDVLRSMKLENPRFGEKQALAVGKRLGITHVATGTISGTAKSATVTYRVWNVATGDPLGDPLSATGDERQLIASLPRLATDLSTTIGALKPEVVSVFDDRLEEVRFVGTLPWDITRPLPKAQLKTLQEYGGRKVEGLPHESPRPILALFYELLEFRNPVVSGESTPKFLETRTGWLAGVLRGNTLILAEFARALRHRDRTEGSAYPHIDVRALRQRYPNNYHLHTAESFYQRMMLRPAEARAAAELAARCAPAHYESWIFLAEAISDQAQAVREGRFVGEMTEEEMRRVARFYAEELPVTLRATELDPGSPMAWMKVSGTAAFLGAEELADRALQRSLQFDPTFEPSYQWGSQLYQPKWLDNPAKFRALAQNAVKHAPKWSPQTRINLAADMIEQGLPELAGKMLLSKEERDAIREGFAGERPPKGLPNLDTPAPPRAAPAKPKQRPSSRPRARSRR
jgi:tetratricopeptide (TPR) repeat protein